MPKQILLVEDSVTMQKVVEITFAHEDYRITSARDGDEALTKLREVRPDVIVVDAGLAGPASAPSTSGYEVAAALRAEPSAREVPVLLLTGNFNPYDEARGQRAGVDAHIVKPFETQVLIDKVADLLRRRSGAGQTNASTLLAIPSPAPLTPAATPATPIGSVNPAHGDGRRATIPPVPPARPQAPVQAPAARAVAVDPNLQRSTLMGIPAVNPLGAPGLRPPPPPGMRVRETGNLPAINPPASSASQSGIFNSPSASSSSLPSWGPRPVEANRAGPSGPYAAGEARPAPSNATTPQGGSASPSLAPAPLAASPAPGGIPAQANLPQMPRLPLLPRAPLPAAVTAVLERIAQRGAEYEAIAKLSVEVIEQICWEVIPELAEVVLRAEVEKHMQQLQATATVSGQQAALGAGFSGEKL